MNTQGIFKFYGPLSDTGDGGGGGGNSDQTDWKAKYESVQQQIASGQYVAKDSYVTLQQKLENAVGEARTIKGQFDSAVATKAVLEDNLQKLQGRVSELDGVVSIKDQEIAKRDGLIERHKTLFKFPELVPFEAEGLLPVPQGDQKLEDLLTNFANRLGSLQETSRRQRSEGSTGEPPPAGGEANKSSQAFFKEALELQKAGKVVEYNITMDKYYAAKAKEGN